MLASRVGLVNVRHEVGKAGVKTLRDQVTVGAPVITVEDQKSLQLANDKRRGLTAIDVDVLAVMADYEAITIHGGVGRGQCWHEAEVSMMHLWRLLFLVVLIERASSPMNARVISGAMHSPIALRSIPKTRTGVRRVGLAWAGG
tara:strand:- start:1478 stop:1909 length:432 start_codon:yes stop_codon:yes gene_type:complete